MNEEQVLKFMKAHQMGVDDMRSYLRLHTLVIDNLRLNEEQKKNLAQIIDNAVILPTRILKEFPNG